jgi:hypothetical protein
VISIEEWKILFGRKLRRWGEGLLLGCQAITFPFGFSFLLPQSAAAVLEGPFGHPERLVPALPPGEAERALWSQLIPDRHELPGSRTVITSPRRMP